MFAGDKAKGGIPRKSSVRVESLPKKQIIFSGIVSKSLALDLDPGRYIYSVTKLIGEKALINYTGEFYHEIEPAAWEKLKDMQPQMCRPIHTTDGARWRCTFPRCRDEEFTSAVSALLHEVSHFGIPQDQFLKNPDLSVLFDGQARVEEYLEESKKQAKSEGKFINPLGGPVATGPAGRE